MAPPLFRTTPPTAQTGYVRYLKFGMASWVKDKTGVTGAIFEFPLLSRAKGEKPCKKIVFQRGAQMIKNDELCLEKLSPESVF